MADTSDSKRKKSLHSGSKPLLIGSGIFVKTLWDYLRNDVASFDFLKTLNSWPIVVSILALSIAYVIVECYREKNKTLRSKEKQKNNKDKIQALESEVRDLREENQSLKCQIERLESEKKNLNQKIEDMDYNRRDSYLLRNTSIRR